MDTNRKICIVGSGGLAREILFCIKDIYKNIEIVNEFVCFMVKDEDYNVEKIDGINVIAESKFNYKEYDVIVGVGDVMLRKKIVSKLHYKTRYKTLIHPSAIISDSLKIGDGSIIMAGAILTCNVLIGKHSVVDRGTNIGHDCVIGNYNHLAPLSVLSGNVIIGDNVFVGASSSIKQGITINNDVLIGMGSIVIKSLNKKGMYAGNPAKLLKK